MNDSLSVPKREIVVKRIVHVCHQTGSIKANFQSVEFSERAEILLFAGENVILKMNR